MKKILLFLVLFFMPIVAFAEDKVEVILFYGEGCPHCESEMEFLDSIEDDYDLEVTKYEVWNSAENLVLLKEELAAKDYSYVGVPVTIIDDRIFIGFGEYIKNDLEKAISDCYNNICEYHSGEASVDETISVPILGEINPKNVSLPVVTAVMGFVDGFNPCAMWVLLFLISMLISLKSKVKRWFLGILFIFVSAATYFLFMASWLNLVFLVSSIVLVRILIGVFAGAAGSFNIYKYFKTRKDDGCDVVPLEKRRPIFDKIKKVINNKSFILAVLGMIVIAISVNVVELACSLGLPVVYTQILAMANISKAGYYLYLLLYTFFFMLDDLIVFSIAMIFLKVTGVSTKYTKYSHLIGGIIMIIIGLLLVFKPELLMFG